MKGIPEKNEKGFVLILALVTMVAMTVIGISLVMNMTTDLQLSSNERDAKEAFQLAEAGINEAIARLRVPATITQDAQGNPIVTPNANFIGEQATDAGYRTVAWNANNSLGRDFGYSVGGNRNSMDNLNYTVTIRYLDESNPEGFCDSNEIAPNDSGNSTAPPAACSKNTPEVVMYGQDFNIDVAMTGITHGKYPVYRITSTGTSQGGSNRTVVAYAGASYFDADIGLALSSNDCAVLNGGLAKVEGPAQVGAGCDCTSIINSHPGTTCTNKTAPDNLNDYLGVPLSTIKANADEVHYCTNATCSAPGDDIPASGNIDSVVTDWGNENNPRLIYIDNAGGKPVTITNNMETAGILIVTGDLVFSGTNFEYEGLVYVLGTVTLNGGGAGSEAEIEGALMAGSVVTMNGNIEVEYEQEALQSVGMALSTSAMIAWKRL